MYKNLMFDNGSKKEETRATLTIEDESFNFLSTAETKLQQAVEFLDWLDRLCEERKKEWKTPFFEGMPMQLIYICTCGCAEKVWGEPPALRTTDHDANSLITYLIEEMEMLGNPLLEAIRSALVVIAKEML